MTDDKMTEDRKELILATLSFYYDSVEILTEDLLLVTLKGAYSIVNLDQHPMTRNYDYMENIGDGLILVRSASQYNILNIHNKFRSFFSLDKENIIVYKNYFIVKDWHTWGITDREHNIILPAMYHAIRFTGIVTQHGEEVEVTTKDYRQIKIYLNGTKVYPYYDITATSDPNVMIALTKVSNTNNDVSLSNSNHRYKLLYKGNFVTEEDYSSILYPSWCQPFGIVEVTSRFAGLINLQGQELIRPNRYNKVQYTGVYDICIAKDHSIKGNYRFVRFGNIELEDSSFDNFEIMPFSNIIKVAKKNNISYLGNDLKLHSNILEAFKVKRLRTNTEIYSLFAYGKWHVVDNLLQPIKNVSSETSQQMADINNWDDLS